MSKFAVTILVFRALQLGLGIAFLVFWIWACAAKYVVPGGPGEYFFGYFSAVVSLAVCAHGIWSFAKKRHLAEHGALYHNARWATDLVIVGLWLGVILIECLVPVPEKDQSRSLYGSTMPTDDSASNPIIVIALGANIAELFSAITFFMTALLLIIPAVKAGRAKKVAKEDPEDGRKDSTVDPGLQVPQPAHVSQSLREE